MRLMNIMHMTTVMIYTLGLSDASYLKHFPAESTRYAKTYCPILRGHHYTYSVSNQLFKCAAHHRVNVRRVSRQECEVAVKRKKILTTEHGRIYKYVTRRCVYTCADHRSTLRERADKNLRIVAKRTVSCDLRAM